MGERRVISAMDEFSDNHENNRARPVLAGIVHTRGTAIAAGQMVGCRVGRGSPFHLGQKPPNHH